MSAVVSSSTSATTVDSLGNSAQSFVATPSQKGKSGSFTATASFPGGIDIRNGSKTGASKRLPQFTMADNPLTQQMALEISVLRALVQAMTEQAHRDASTIEHLRGKFLESINLLIQRARERDESLR